MRMMSPSRAAGRHPGRYPAAAQVSHIATISWTGAVWQLTQTGSWQW
jgi:hypothetical protein